MQSVCLLVSEEQARKAVDLRASLSEHPSLGAIYDPPFVHCTLQLADEYDWDRLASALALLAKDWQPFTWRTVGLLVFTGDSAVIAVAPYRDQRLVEFHAAVWEAASAHAQGRIDPFYHPDRWLPHITIKRCGHDAAAFGHAMASLAHEQFLWTMMADNIAVQHDPGKNSLTHYLRVRFPLGPSEVRRSLHAPAANEMNATCVEIRDGKADGSRCWKIRIRLDDGNGHIEQQWDAPSVVRLMAEARCSTAHFAGARCRVDGETVTAVVPNTPFPVA